MRSYNRYGCVPGRKCACPSSFAHCSAWTALKRMIGEGDPEAATDFGEAYSHMRPTGGPVLVEVLVAATNQPAPADRVAEVFPGAEPEGDCWLVPRLPGEWMVELADHGEISHRVGDLRLLAEMP